MADIDNSTVFTNGVSCGTSDLLRQAFQEVVDDEDHDNEFVAFLQGEGDGSQTIHLTHAQASALRLTFEVDSVDEQTNNITYNQQQNVILNDIQNAGGLETGESSPQQNDSIDTLNFQTTSNSEINNAAKVECPQLQEWATHQEASQNEGLENESMQIEGLQTSNGLFHNNDQYSEHQNVHKIYVQQNSVAGNGAGVNNGEIQFTVEATTPQNFQQNNAIPRTSQAQILQRLPVILPSSQFIIKPAQTILKSTKNIRILPSTNKMGNVGTINGNTSQNSILLPKGVLNTLSPQILKATPITTQLINSSTISTQLLNTSQILTTNCDFQSQNGNINGTRAQNLINTPIRLSPAIKTSTGMIPRGNGQQFVIPTLKTSQDSTIVKSVQVSNGNSVKPGISGQFLKSVQIPAQMIRAANTTFVKTTTASSTPVKMTTTTNAPIIFRTASLLKPQDFKTVTTNASSILRNSSQSPSTPISILKPQSKGVTNSPNRQNLIINSQNLVANPQNARFVQKTMNCQINENVNERLKTAQTNLKQKANDNAMATAKVVKRAKVAGLHNPVALTPEQTDTTKPLGSTENPIQIVQQGQSFHSMQRLTQSQLKQISHVLQQRSQEAALPNERIVYRVVFPDELDLRMKNAGNLLKGRGGKRGRPKKTAVKPAVPVVKMPTAAEEEHEEMKDDRKKVVARTRSGRLSRPPRHMVRDYKHLHHLDFTQPDLDDSDGGYSDYNTNAEKMVTDGSPKELLSGLEVPKRKISDHFRCPTCNKIYLGRSRMAKHFETHPDHGRPEQLPPATPDPELKRAATPQDPLKRKGKKRGPWAYVTPEAKSERRQVKLKEAISVCENLEIINIAAKPVLNAQSLFDLLVLKSDNNVRTFLSELKGLMNKVRQQIGAMLTVAVDGDSDNGDVVDLHENLLCDALGLDPGFYKIKNEAFRKPEETFNSQIDTMINEEPPLKLQKTHDTDDSKEISEEGMSSGFSESSDMSVSDFLNERKNDLANSNCPEVLTALTLMPRNTSPINAPEVTKSNSMSKLLISNPEIQNQISENPGFQKIDINSSKSYRKLESLKDGFAKLTESLELTSCSSVFTKLDGSYEQPKMQTLQQSFIKLEPMEQGFKLENSTVSTYEKEDSQGFDKMQNGYESLETGSPSFVKGFHKLISKIVPMESDENCIKNEASTMDGNSGKMMRGCKMSDGLPILQDSVQIMSGSCDPSSIFGSTDNLDMGKITGYDHIPHLDILSTSGVIDKHLMMDEKLVEQLHLVDQTNLVDELVSERLKNIMPDNILENNLIPNGTNLDTDLDFEALSEEFNRNTRS